MSGVGEWGGSVGWESGVAVWGGSVGGETNARGR